MNLNVAKNLEIDIMQANEILEGFELAQKHKIPAVVVHQDLISDAIRVRGIKQGTFKILTPIDWPKGDNFGMSKIQNIKLDAMRTDGYEIFLTPKDNASDIRKEMRLLSEFIRSNLNQLSEVRFVLGTFVRDPSIIEKFASTLKDCPAPTMLRNDHHTKAQQNKANIKVHQATIEDLRKHTNVSIKISGNVSLKTIMHCTKAARFGVNLKQAQSIIKESKQDPEKLRNSLASINELE